MTKKKPFHEPRAKGSTCLHRILHRVYTAIKRLLIAMLFRNYNAGADPENFSRGGGQL